MRREVKWLAWLVAALVAAAALTGCGVEPVGDQPPPAGASAQPSDEPQTPRAVPGDQRFRIGDTAQFDDGLRVEIAGTEASKAKDTDLGAEATNGEIVIVSIRLENHTGETFDPRQMLIVATYGNAQVAPVIQDETGELTPGFGEDVLDGDEGVATIGFAIPASGLEMVTITIDPNDDLHEPLSFTGAVQPR